MRRHSFSLFAIRVATAGALALSATACEPLVITVTTTNDGGRGSLRAAIDAANASDASEVRIELATGTYRLTRCGAADDDNAAGDLDLRFDRPITLTAKGPGVIIEQTCPDERVLHSQGVGLLKLSGITLTGGKSLQSGGGLFAAADVELTRCTVQGNSGTGGGGGAFVWGTLTLVDTQVLDNAAVPGARLLPGTGIWVPGPVSGAGVWATSVVARNTTIARNYLASCSQYPVQGASEGGGIFAEHATLTNVTISDQTCPSSCGPAGNNGMAVRARTLELDHATIADNRGGAALYVETLSARHSLVSAPDHSVCPRTPLSNSASHNWFSDASCALTGVNQQQSAEFALGALADNGGPVLTRMPGAESVLIDQIATCSLSQDARGLARPQGPACDIGAVEVE